MDTAPEPTAVPFDFLHPATITSDRYGGIYSGGAWLAFPLFHSELPDEPFSNDIDAASFWEEHNNSPIGRGATPDAAYSALLRRIEALPPSQVAAGKFGNTHFWELAWPSGETTTVSWFWEGEGHGPQVSHPNQPEP
jgi:hypothetical protein